MTTRREILGSIGLIGASAFAPTVGLSDTSVRDSSFRYCLNTSTISGQKLGIVKYVEIASKAGYDGIEVWMRDVKQYLEAGNSIQDLRKQIDDSGLKVEDAIGFSPWLVEGEAAKEAGFKQMREEMKILGAIGGTRIAAPPAGVSGEKPLDLFKAGIRYRQLLDLGRETGVMPQLEFWGSSPSLYHMGQIMMMGVVANDPDVRFLPDIYHLFRGDSGFESLKMLNGQAIEVFHMNDYPGDKPREEQVDADRIYPGDGVAPIKQILTDLKAAGGTTVLSLELFNREYWKRDPLEVAKEGIRKMKEAVGQVE